MSDKAKFQSPFAQASKQSEKRLQFRENQKRMIELEQLEAKTKRKSRCKSK